VSHTQHAEDAHSVDQVHEGGWENGWRRCSVFGTSQDFVAIDGEGAFFCVEKLMSTKHIDVCICVLTFLGIGWQTLATVMKVAKVNAEVHGVLYNDLVVDIVRQMPMPVNVQAWDAKT